MAPHRRRGRDLLALLALPMLAACAHDPAPLPPSPAASPPTAPDAAAPSAPSAAQQQCVVDARTEDDFRKCLDVP